MNANTRIFVTLTENDPYYECDYEMYVPFIPRVGEELKMVATNPIYYSEKRDYTLLRVQRVVHDYSKTVSPVREYLLDIYAIDITPESARHYEGKPNA